MKSSKYMLQALAMPFIATAFSMACATATTVELTNARVAYGRASNGPNATLVPSDVHKAKTALDQAEQAFAEEKGSPKAIDLAYIAERTAQIAEARAEGATAENSTSKSKREFGDTQQAIAKTTEGTLVKTREQLAEAERGQAQQAQQRQESDKKAAASEQRAVASEQQAKDANEALAKLAAKEEERGTVITLSGSVLFRTNDATLMPEAQTRLDQVASALVAKGHEVVVEGYTDSKG